MSYQRLTFVHNFPEISLCISNCHENLNAKNSTSYSTRAKFKENSLHSLMSSCVVGTLFGTFAFKNVNPVTCVIICSMLIFYLYITPIKARVSIFSRGKLCILDWIALIWCLFIFFFGSLGDHGCAFFKRFLYHPRHILCMS